MSSRQRSFFDQDHTGKPKYRSKPRYHRTQSADNVLRAKGSKPDVNMAAKPIDASSQSKKKLKSFQFVDGAPEMTTHTTTDKENAKDTVKSAETPTTRLGPDHGNQDMTGVDTAGEALRAVPPSTPATRLPLADLIGNNETVWRNPQLLVTPEEHVQWQHSVHDATPVDAFSRKRKRARSSSPATSSQNEASNYFPESLATHKTPQNDPTEYLWSRYAAVEDMRTTPNSKRTVEFAHLIEKSSPHSSATAGSVSGLRRWASCGAEFPSATKPKKRRTVGDTKEGDTGGAHRLKRSEQESVGNGSRVGRLLERIQETLAHNADELPPPAPSSSSPLPEAGRFEQADEVSPLQRLPSVEDREEASDEDIESPSGRVASKLHLRSSSEFGDCDIDMDMVANVEPQHVPSRPIAVPEADSSKAASERTQVLLAQVEALPQDLSEQPQTVVSDEGFDEFAEDDDVFEADMEVVASKFDTPDEATTITRPQVQAQHQAQYQSFSDKSQQSDMTDALMEAAESMEKQTVVIDDSDDEFGDDEIDVEHFAAAEAVATQRLQTGTASQTHSEQQLRTIQRYLITKVVEGTYNDERGRSQVEKVLVVQDERAKSSRAIVLRQAWIDTPATEGSYVHVVGEFSFSGECIIDNAQNLLILHPDHLVSATTVADSFSCLRKAVLNIRVKATSDASPATLHGHMLHKLFQEALKANTWDTKSLGVIVDKMLPQYFETMAEIGLNESQVKDHMKSKFIEMRTWASIFVRARPTKESIVKDRNGQQVTLSVHKLLDVEENVESPMYGLKGMIDATVQVRLASDQGEQTLTVPFELKTGKRTNPAHQAQTMLYTLLTSDRYDLSVFYGILYYLDSAEMRRIPALRHELLQMIMQRNKLARYMRDRLSLPPVLEKSHICGHCYAQKTCFVYHRLAENGDGSNFTNAKQKFDELVRNLKPVHRDFFVKWDDLLTKEEAETMRFRRELWTMLSHERERLGRCFAHVVIEPGSACEQVGNSKINRFEYIFVKRNSAHGFTFTESQITVGEAIVISDEKGHFALAKGYVTKVQRKRITASVDRRLHNAWVRRPRFDAVTNQDFEGLMEVPDKDGGQPSLRTQDDAPAVVYRLDKDEFSNGMATVRNNLVALMDDNVFKSSDLRSLIIESRAPSFKTSPSTNPLPSTESLQMNADQDAAVAKVMAAQDYALVLGMPGTGKTTTISYIIRALVARKKTVLLASYTHTAVDNILLKLKDSGFPILRMGAIAKIHPTVQEFAILAERQKSTLQEVMESWHRPLIVATTCLGVNHPLFSQRTFDYCIVDEASQITLPVCLGPIRMAKTFILVGDHFQLPPLVQNKEALEGGYDVSLFRLLSERHPDAVTNLEHQYRMAKEIMLMANKLIYSGRLKCGNETVAERTIDIPHQRGVDILHTPNSLAKPPTNTAPQLCRSASSPSCHLGALADPRQKVLFFNTDRLLPSAAETVQGSRVTNTLEARLTLQCAYALSACGVPANDIGVITFYRSQLALLRQSLRYLTSDRPSLVKDSSVPCPANDVASIEMHTADKFQGRDKEAVIVSFVRSNEMGQVGELLKDWRRINVAITRARSKLILIGSKQTLYAGGNDVLKGLIDICDERGWIMDLDARALDGHVIIDGAVSQTQPATGPTAKRLSSPRKQVRRNDGTSITPSGSTGSQHQSSPKRRPLGEIEGRNVTPPKRNGLKVPEKRGIISQRAVLKGRNVMGDLFNEAI